MKNLIRKLFLVKEIKSIYGTLHFRRWRIIETKWLSIYIHRIYKADEDPYLHDHPWDYYYLILKGSYDEKSFDTKTNESNKDIITTVKPGSCGFNDGKRFHKINKLNTESVTTLFITGKRYRDWGYKINNVWVDNQVYRKNKYDIEELTQEFINKNNINETTIPRGFKLL